MPDSERCDDHHSEQYPSRRRLRLQYYDYSQPGYYFITICTYNRRPWFGNIVNGQMELNAIGHLAQREWESLSYRYRDVELDQFVIMPNHLHGILILTEDAGYHHAQKRPKPTVSEIICRFKGAATYHIHKMVAPDFAWQKSFYDSVVRNQSMLNTLRRYMTDNPTRWSEDQLYTGNATSSSAFPSSNP